MLEEACMRVSLTISSNCRTLKHNSVIQLTNWKFLIIYYIYCADTPLSGLQFLVQSFHSPIFSRKAQFFIFNNSQLLTFGPKTLAFIMQIKPLVKPTRTIINFRGLQYAWHDFVSKSMDTLLFFHKCHHDIFFSCPHPLIL